MHAPCLAAHMLTYFTRIRRYDNSWYSWKHLGLDMSVICWSGVISGSDRPANSSLNRYACHDFSSIFTARASVSFACVCGVRGHARYVRRIWVCWIWITLLPYRFCPTFRSHVCGCRLSILYKVLPCRRGPYSGSYQNLFPVYIVRPTPWTGVVMKTCSSPNDWSRHHNWTTSSSCDSPCMHAAYSFEFRQSRIYSSRIYFIYTYPTMAVETYKRHA